VRSMTSLRLRLFAPSFCIARIRRLPVARLVARHPLKVVAAARLDASSALAISSDRDRQSCVQLIMLKSHDRDDARRSRVPRSATQEIPHSKRSRDPQLHPSTWVAGVGRDAVWRALDGRYGDVKRERRYER